MLFIIYWDQIFFLDIFIKLFCQLEDMVIMGKGQILSFFGGNGFLQVSSLVGKVDLGEVFFFLGVVCDFGQGV